MFRAEILWFANGPTLKMHGNLAGEWAEQARRLVTTDVVPKRLIVDLTEISYVDSKGECLLSWLASVGAEFVANSVYASAVCERLGLSCTQRTASRRQGNKEGEVPNCAFPCRLKPCLGRHNKLRRSDVLVSHEHTGWECS